MKVMAIKANRGSNAEIAEPMKIAGIGFIGEVLMISSNKGIKDAEATSKTCPRLICITK